MCEVRGDFNKGVRRNGTTITQSAKECSSDFERCQIKGCLLFVSYSFMQDELKSSLLGRAVAYSFHSHYPLFNRTIAGLRNSKMLQSFSVNCELHLEH